MRKNFGLLFLVLGMLCIAVSCTDEDDAISLAGHDTYLEGTLYDSLSVKAYTVGVDTMRTSITTSANRLLGYYRDNVFGKVEAGIYTQLSLGTKSSFDFSSLQIDSMVLTLASSKYYPSSYDATNPYKLTLQVYQLNEDLKSNESYYSNSTVQYNSTPLYNSQIEYRPKDSLTIGDKKEPPQIRVKLPDVFAQQFKRNFSSNDDFLSFMKGLYIKVNPSSDQGLIAYVNLSSVYSGMRIYYTDNEGNHNYFTFIVSSTSVAFSTFKHDYSGTVLQPLQTNPKDSINGDNQLYLESLAGTRLKVEFPDLLAWGKGKPYIINQAALVLPLSDATPDTIPPGILYYALINDDGTFTARDTAKYNRAKREYRLYMNRDIQRTLTQVIKNNGILIGINGAAVEANRCVLNGPLFSERRMRLEILYTESK